jgi:two-component system phosphate regulon sensor histidine kinase PhoR
MARKRLLWQLYPSYLLIILIGIIAVLWYASKSLRETYVERAAADLEIRARLLEKQVLAKLTSVSGKSVDSLCKELGKRGSTRITVILNSGKVIGDSEEDPGKMDNHANRPEVRGALGGSTGTSTRFSRTLQQNMMYVAVPLRVNGEIVGVLRTSIPLTAIGEVLRAIQFKIALAGLIVAVLAAVVSWVVSRRISKPLEKLKRGAELFARGDLESRLAVPDSEELGGLAEAMNHMASQLDNRIRAETKQRNEMEAVLSSMVEGVLAVDAEERVIGINRAAAELLKVDSVHIKDHTIHEVVRNSELLRFVARTLVSMRPVEGDIVLRNGGEKFLQAHGTILRDAEGRGIGALIVLNDVTRIRRLENVRREFVANVTHEIRTPVTSVKGFVETLLDGALSDPENAKHFLTIIARQTDRLNAIIDDLLSLSRIEQETEDEEIVLKEDRIVDVLQAAIQVCETKAVAKKITIDLECEEGVLARINPPLLEQAVVNLIDNAIKYSDRKGTVLVGAARRDAEIIVIVRDQGCGITKEHLPRLFERFYRVDKARSRKLGGTGLGLAIVKHIAQAHGGKVTVESAPGKGSNFQIHLPASL